MGVFAVARPSLVVALRVCLSHTVCCLSHLYTKIDRLRESERERERERERRSDKERANDLGPDVRFKPCTSLKPRAPLLLACHLRSHVIAATRTLDIPSRGAACVSREEGPEEIGLRTQPSSSASAGPPLRPWLITHRLACPLRL